MGGMNSLRNRLVQLLSGPIQRKLPKRGPKPRIGTYVVHVQKEIRLVVPAGMSDELWDWLMDHGWRVVTHRPERRVYEDIPPSWVTRLQEANDYEREWVLDEAMKKAQPRSALARGVTADK
jgi:hypothetical protein